MKNKVITLLLKWARKIIYKYDKSFPPFIETQYKIQRITSERIFTFTELEKEHFHRQEAVLLESLKNDMSKSIAKVMLEIGAIKFDFVHSNDQIKIVGTTYVPEKLNYDKVR